jgi:hypothetical protein
MWNLHATLLSKIIPRYFALSTNRIFLPLSCDVVVGLGLPFDPESYAVVGSPMLDRSKMIQTKMDTLVLQAGDWVWI